MKINPIMAVLAAVFGIGGALYAYSFAGLSADLATNGSITLVSSILGLIGIYLFEKDYKFAIAQYTVAGLGILIRYKSCWNSRIYILYCSSNFIIC